MIIKKLINSLLLVLLLASTLYAGTLTVVPLDSTIVTSETPLVPYSWDYRAVTTRKWLPGCMQYDFLQGTGWFPATYYEDFSPEKINNEYVFTTKRSFGEWYCGAEMDRYNFVQLEYVNENGVTLYGRFPVVPDGEEDYDEVNCHIDETKGVYNAIVCEEAHVDWHHNANIVIDVLLD